MVEMTAITEKIPVIVPQRGAPRGPPVQSWQGQGLMPCLAPELENEQYEASIWLTVRSQKYEIKKYDIARRICVEQAVSLCVEDRVRWMHQILVTIVSRTNFVRAGTLLRATKTMVEACGGSCMDNTILLMD